MAEREKDLELKNFAELLEAVKRRPPVTVAVAAAEDEELLKAVKLAESMGFVKPILVGDAEKVEALVRRVGLERATIEPAAGPDLAAARAVELVKNGEARVLMKGLVNTSVYLRAILSREKGLRTGRLLSLLAVYELPQYHKLIYAADSGINVAPDLNQKKAILENSLEAMRRMGFTRPKVAALASNELVDEKIPATVDAAALAEMGRAGTFGDCEIEGPLSLDIAFSREASEHKGFESRISGEADLLIFPNIEAGNFLGKSWLLFNQAKWAGLVLGAGAPVILGSRSDTSEVKINSIALGCLSAFDA